MNYKHLIKHTLLCFSFLGLPAGLNAQHNQSYVSPEDSLVKQKLEWWGDIKFGLLMHWGSYSQWGVVESWSICPEDEDWCRRRGPYSHDYFEYRRAYEGLQHSFNPVKFDPKKWAKAARDAGMRYLVFTTKHHDGFCMFDTKETSYKVTDSTCPFAADPRANITREVFDAFRAEGMGIGVYFSKADWHCQDYWDPYFPPVDRNPNYDLTRYPEKWAKFKTFTYNQIKELMTGYGPVDILWLDGGWVQPMTPDSPRWGTRPVSQDIDMAGIAKMARGYQPGLIIVDRAVEGPYQNYLTPEQAIPDSILPYPWETCMTMATSWSYVENDQYKPAIELIHMLCTIVSRGGNFLLNIGPGPDGELAPDAYARMKEIGQWMKINQEAIYGSKPGFLTQDPKMVCTRGKTGWYLIYLADKDEVMMPGKISFRADIKVSQAFLLGHPKALKVQTDSGRITLTIPESIRTKPPCAYAWVFHLQ